MREISRQELGIRSGDPHFVIMKKTAFGDLDINSYHDTFKDAMEELLELPYTDYRIYRIRRRQSESICDIV